MNKDKQCCYKHCDEPVAKGDSIFCDVHRDGWRMYCKRNKLSDETTTPSLINHIKRFCLL